MLKQYFAKQLPFS